MSFLGHFRIRGRLIFGFAVVLILMVALAGVTILQILPIRSDTDAIVAEDMPAARLSGGLATDINASIAALSGWMLTGEAQYKADRATVWADIDRTVAALDPYLAADEGADWTAFQETLAEFRAQQDAIEAIANTPAEQPATQRLANEGKTFNDTMLKQATAILTEEQKIDPTPARRQLFAQMGNIRAGIGVAMGALRTYLLSGEQGFLNQYNGVWKWVTGQIAALDGKRDQLNEAQNEALDALIQAVDGFSPLADDLLRIRQSARWNEAHYLTRTELAPRTEALLTFLSGPRDTDTGLRDGGVVDRLAERLEARADSTRTAIRNLMVILGILLLIALAVAAAVVLATAASIVDPIRQMTDAMARLAGGELDTEIPARDDRGEIGAMAGAMVVFRENAAERRRAEAENQETQRRIAARAQRQDELAAAFENDVQSTLRAVGDAGAEMQGAAETMRDRVGTTDGLAENVAGAAREASGNVANVAAAVEELTFSVNAILEQVREATTITQEASRQSEVTEREINGLAGAADKIGEVVTLIAEIAEKTNLLALNATIEAARAGEAGKGFAVVAGEVKNLANQTATATQEITRKVEDIQSSSKEAVGQVEAIRNVIDRMDAIAAHISGAVEEQRGAAQDISSSMAASAEGADAVTRDIDAVRGASADAGDAAGAVEQGVKALAGQADTLRRNVEAFLGDMKATRQG